MHVCTDDSHEPIEADDSGKTPYGGVRGLGFEKVNRAKVVDYQGNNRFYEILVIRHGIKKRTCGSFPCDIVPWGTQTIVGLIVDSGVRLTEVVTKDGEADYEIFEFIAYSLVRKRIHTIKRMRPHIALGMPFWILGAIDKIFELWEVDYPVSIL